MCLVEILRKSYSWSSHYWQVGKTLSYDTYWKWWVFLLVQGVVTIYYFELVLLYLLVLSEYQ